MTTSAQGQDDNRDGFPPKPKQRIQALDVIRGVSILGILAVNADGYAAPIAASLNPARWPFPNAGSTALLYWVMDLFFHDKFVTLFSMLFGVSLFLVGGERTDKQRGRILWRRLAALFGFAMLHGFGIWWGDILSLYACAGAAMTFCRSWRPRTLMLVGALLYAGMALRSFPASIAVHQDHHVGASWGGEATAGSVSLERARELRETIQEAHASWAGAYRVNTRTYFHQLKGVPSQIPATLGLMMVGLALFKLGLLAGKAGTRTYVALLVSGTLALAAEALLLWTKDVRSLPQAGEHSVELLLAPLVSLAYASGLILILRSGGQRWLSPFSATGRMAFTNYLSQSVIMTSIFYGGRGGLMGQINRGGLWLIVIGVWLLQLVWSSLWLGRFEMGPFEWVWRCITYGKIVPLVKARQ